MASWQKHPLSALLSILVFGAYCIYRAMQYGSAEADEQTTIAHVHEYNGVSRANCLYHFTVDGKAYSGGDCRWGTRSGYFDATVYYDPSRPSINSLSEFGAASKHWYQWAAWSMGSGCLIFGMVVWWGAYKKSKRGIGGSAAERIRSPIRIRSIGSCEAPPMMQSQSIPWKMNPIVRLTTIGHD